MKTGDTTAVFHCTFGALTEVHFLHSIYHFKAQEVENPTLQTVYDLELKWGRYSLRKTTASSWRTNSHLANLELQRAKLKPTLRNGNGIQPHSHREAQLAKVILQLANLELNVRKWIPSCEINLRDFRKSPCNVWNLHAKWDICAPTLLDLFLRYFCINFHSSPYNPLTIRFLS